MRPVFAFLSVILIAGCSSKAAKNEPASNPPAAGAKAETKKADVKANKAAAKAEAAKGDVAGKAACKSGADERLIEIITKGEGGCAVQYTKQNEMKEIANAEHEMQHCNAVLEKVKGKLEAAGFSCN